MVPIYESGVYGDPKGMYVRDPGRLRFSSFWASLQNLGYECADDAACALEKALGKTKIHDNYVGFTAAVGFKTCNSVKRATQSPMGSRVKPIYSHNSLDGRAGRHGSSEVAGDFNAGIITYYNYNCRQCPLLTANPGHCLQLNQHWNFGATDLPQKLNFAIFGTLSVWPSIKSPGAAQRHGLPGPLYCHTHTQLVACTHKVRPWLPQAEMHLRILIPMFFLLRERLITCLLWLLICRCIWLNEVLPIAGVEKGGVLVCSGNAVRFGSFWKWHEKLRSSMIFQQIEKHLK